MIEAEQYLKARTERQHANMAVQDVCSLRPRSSLSYVSIPVLYYAGFAIISGVFGFACAFLRELGAVIPEVLAAILLAPPIEEILKIAIPIIVMEHRTSWIGQGRDLLWFAMGSALVFAVAENLMYSFVFLDDPSAELLWWRWIACTAMHVAATALSGIGLLRAYEQGKRTSRPPRFIWEWSWLAGAIGVHMAYNAIAVFLAEPF